jgi:broad specificity phosphatase PhoE
MPKLFIIRHCESVANSRNLLASRMDFPLSEKGLLSASQIAGNFSKKHKVGRIISSPLTRAMQTAAPFSEIFNLNIETDIRLMEQDFGNFAGRTFEELRDNKEYQWDRSKRWDWIPAGNGESYRMVAQRVLPFLTEVGKLKEGENILIVTHAVTMRMIRGILENTLPLYPENLPANGEIWEVDFEGPGRPYVIK